MKPFKCLLLLAGFCITFATHAKLSEHLLWEKVPLTIELPLEKERLIQFPQTIKIIDEMLPSNLEVLKVKNSLYLKSHGDFHDARMIVQLLPDGEVVILNLKSNPHFENTTPIEILIDDPKEEGKKASSHYEYNAIQLTRFAIQSLYSPERVREIPAGVYRTPLHTQKTVPLFYGASIEAHPIASWRGGHLYVTAVELKNLLNKSVKLNHKRLIGQWQTATFYPSTNLSSRNQHESTTVFLISDVPFREALTNQTGFNR